MAAIDGLPANFLISEAAKRGIELLKADWNRRFADKAVIPAIAWGEIENGRTGTGKIAPGGFVVVSFYTNNEIAEVGHLKETVSGIDLIFYVNKTNYHHFQGKILDYSEKAHFFLR